MTSNLGHPAQFERRMEMILAEKTITKVSIDGHEADVLRQICVIVHFYLSDHNINSMWTTDVVSQKDIKVFVDFILGKEQQ
jgi:hypothetical protein